MLTYKSTSFQNTSTVKTNSCNCHKMTICFRTQFNPLSANPTKWSNTLKQFVGKFLTNCLRVFDHSVGFALEGLKG